MQHFSSMKQAVDDPILVMGTVNSHDMLYFEFLCCGQRGVHGFSQQKLQQ